jgi:hypothetical protein
VALVAVLDAPALADWMSQSFFSGADTSSSSPPGVPTYLFVSSFRI